MAYFNENVVLGGEILIITRGRPRKVPSTRKQLIGKEIIRISIPGRNQFDWEITLEGKIFGANMETDRDNLLTLQDNQDKNGYAYADGSHDGTYFIEDITFDDSDDAQMIFRYTIRIIEKNQ